MTNIEEIHGIATEVAIIKEKFNIYEEMAQVNRRALYGNNGTPGLVTRVERIQDKLDSIEKILWVLLSTIIIAISGQVLSLVFKGG